MRVCVTQFQVPLILLIMQTSHSMHPRGLKDLCQIQDCFDDQQNQQDLTNNEANLENNDVIAMMAYTQKANSQYMRTHEKWDQLRSKIKVLKLDNITTRTYKNNDVDLMKTHCSMFMLKSEPTAKKTKRRTFKPKKEAHLPVFKFQEDRKVKDFELSNQRSEIQRIYRSKVASASDASYQKPKVQKVQVKENPRSFHKQKASYFPQQIHRTEHCLNAYKRQRPYTGHLKQRQQFESPSTKNMSNPLFKGGNDDLLNISLVSEADYTSRQIVRRKSNIKGSNIEVIEASLLAVEVNKKIRTLILFTMDRTSHEPKFKSYRLIIGPTQIRELSQKFGLAKEEIAVLASTLAEYLEVKQQKLKLNKQLLRSVNVGENPQENRLSFEANPLARLVTPKQKSRVRGVYKNVSSKNGVHPHPIINSQQFQKIANFEQSHPHEQPDQLKQMLEQKIQLQNSNQIGQNILYETKKSVLKQSLNPNNIIEEVSQGLNPNESQIQNQSCISSHIQENKSAAVQKDKIETIKSQMMKQIQEESSC